MRLVQLFWVFQIHLADDALWIVNWMICNGFLPTALSPLPTGRHLWVRAASSPSRRGYLRIGCGYLAFLGRSPRPEDWWLWHVALRPSRCLHASPSRRTDAGCNLCATLAQHLSSSEGRPIKAAGWYSSVWSLGRTGGGMSFKTSQRHLPEVRRRCGSTGRCSLPGSCTQTSPRPAVGVVRLVDVLIR